MWKHTFKKCVFFLAVLWYKRKGPINRTYPAIKASIFWCCKRSIFVTNSIYSLWGNAPRKHEPQISRVCPCPPQCLTLQFQIDGLILNDDRHLNNIAVIARDGWFDYCPVFDQGAGLLSNVMDNPFEIIHKSLIAQAKARPLSKIRTAVPAPWTAIKSRALTGSKGDRHQQAVTAG